jgi:pyruvate dehydrogenase E2 component (dihydrolipoamide acetyltransferase)
MLLPILNSAGDDATVESWLVAAGDVISEDMPVLVVEMEKAAVEVESSVAGRVVRLLVNPGDVVKPGQPVLEVE